MSSSRPTFTREMERIAWLPWQRRRGLQVSGARPSMEVAVLECVPALSRRRARFPAPARRAPQKSGAFARGAAAAFASK